MKLLKHYKRRNIFRRLRGVYNEEKSYVEQKKCCACIYYQSHFGEMGYCKKTKETGFSHMKNIDQTCDTGKFKAIPMIYILFHQIF